MCELCLTQPCFRRKIEPFVVGGEEGDVCAPSSRGSGCYSMIAAVNCVRKEGSYEGPSLVYWERRTGVKIALGSQLENMMSFCKYNLEFLMSAIYFPVYFLKSKLTAEDALKSVHTISYLFYLNVCINFYLLFYWRIVDL